MASPSGRQVDFWHGSKGHLLPRSTLEKLVKELPNVETIIPTIEHVVTLVREDSSGKKFEVESATLASTARSDPLLVFHGVPTLDKGERAVLLGQSLAKELDAHPGDKVMLSVHRRSGDGASLELTVKAIIALGGDVDQIGYLDSDIQESIELFLRGYQVRELNWPAAGNPAPDKYAGYLVFFRPGKNLTEADREALDRAGIIADKPTLETLSDIQTLFRIKNLQIYFLHTVDSLTNPNERMDKSPPDIIKYIEADVVALPWNAPREYRIAGRTFHLIGCGLPTRTWLRSYLIDPLEAFDLGDEEMMIKVGERIDHPVGKGLVHLDMEVSGVGNSVPLQVIPVGAWMRAEAGRAIAFLLSPTSPGPIATAACFAPLPPSVSSRMPAGDESIPRAVAPVQLLAHLDALQHGTAQFDAVRRMFVPVPREVSYPSAPCTLRISTPSPKLTSSCGTGTTSLIQRSGK